MTIEILAAKIATYIFTEAARETTSGAWCIDFKDINAQFGVNLEESGELLEAIQEQLDSAFGHLICDYEVYDNQFDINLFTNYCIENVDNEEEEE